MKFIYYCAGKGKATLEAVRSYGLGYAFDDGAFEHREVMGGPDGGNGFLFASPGARELKLQKDDQTWRKLPHRECRPELWVGMWNDSPPTPQDVARPAMLKGVELKLGDGNLWQIPIVRRWDGQSYESSLPAYIDYDEDGAPIKGNPLAKYSTLWEATTPIAEAWANGSTK